MESSCDKTQAEESHTSSHSISSAAPVYSFEHNAQAIAMCLLPLYSKLQLILWFSNKISFSRFHRSALYILSTTIRNNGVKKRVKLELLHPSHREYCPFAFFEILHRLLPTEYHNAPSRSSRHDRILRKSEHKNTYRLRETFQRFSSRFLGILKIPQRASILLLARILECEVDFAITVKVVADYHSIF